MGPRPRQVHLFNEDGKYVDTYDNVKQAAVRCEIKDYLIYTSIQRGNTTGGLGYFTYNRGFSLDSHEPKKVIRVSRKKYLRVLKELPDRLEDGKEFNADLQDRFMMKLF
jgi:hypothetical protein